MLNKCTNDTSIVGILGHPIKHTFSPIMHNLAFELLNLNFIYLPFDVPQSNLKTAIKGMVALGIKGFNVTIPHKENVINYISDISEEASVIGAVNTIVNDSGRLSGFNTDTDGIIASLMPFKDQITGNEVCVIGAGGAARSAIYSLIRHFKPSRINIINRNEQRAESLKEYFSSKMHFSQMKAYELFPPELVGLFRQSALIMHTTSVGMLPNVDDSVTLLRDSFTQGQIVFDIVYNPIKTKLLEIAEEAGATTINGLKMFVHQGARSFELWTGEKMPIEKIENALKLYI